MGEKQVFSPKISLSGVNRTLVPFVLVVSETFKSFVIGKPFEYSCLYIFFSLITSITNLSDKAFTTDAPTPCNPPEVW